MMKPVVISGKNPMNVDSFVNVARHRAKVKCADDARSNIFRSNQRVLQLAHGDEPVYGMNTGFGKNSSIRISKEDMETLQENIIRSHACGVGEAYETEVVRGAMLLRLVCFSQGYSGVRPELFDTLLSMLNKNLVPIVPSRGSLGSSGDLAPLAHMCLPIIGLGKVQYKGKILNGLDGMRAVQIPTLKLSYKEGLALTNGCVFGESLAAISLYEAKRIAVTAEIVSAMLAESLEGIALGYRAEVHEARPHKGQAQTAKNLLRLLDGSTLIKWDSKTNVHSCYSIKCIPQILGPLRTALPHVEEIVLTEMNSATDNPLIFERNGTVYSLSGGNFHGQNIGNATAYLAIALGSVFKNIHTLVSRATDNALSDGLPKFLTENSGLNSGLMLAQYTSGSIYNEYTGLATPLTIQNISSCANFEDATAMSNAQAKNLYKAVQLAYESLAIGLITGVQALNFRINSPSPDRTDAVVLGKGTSKAYDHVKEQLSKSGMEFPYNDGKKPLGEWINMAIEIVKSGKLIDICKDYLDNHEA